MATIAELMVKIGVDMNGFAQGLNKAQNSLNTFGNSMTSAGVKMSMGITAPLTAFAVKAVQTASALDEIQNVVNVTFGKSASVIDAWSKTTMDSFGLTELQAKQMSSSMGAMTKSMGLSDQQMQTMAMGLTGLAGDMSSFYNLPHDVMWEKIRSGISGETEPLKQLGINMSEATLATYAMEQGITKAYSAMSEAEKVQIRYNYLMKVTADAQGDYLRTNEGFANQLRNLQGQFINLSGTLGQIMIPYALKMVQATTNMIAKFQALSPVQKEWTVKLLATAAVIGPLLILLGSMSKGLALVLGAVKLLVSGIGAMSTAFGAAIGASGGLSGALVALRGNIIKLAGTIGPVLALASALLALAASMVAVKKQNTAYVAGGGTVGGLTIGKERGATTQKDYMDTVKKGQASIDAKSKIAEDKKIAKELAASQADINKLMAGLDKSMADMSPGGGGGGGGGGGAVALETAWQKVAKTLGASLQEIGAKFDISASVARRTTGEYAALQIEAQGLTAEIETQNAIVANSKGAWEASSKAKGENADETIALKMEYLNEQKSLEDLLTAQFNNQKAMEEQKTAVEELQKKIIDINDTYNKESLKAYEDYTQGVAKANKELNEGIAQVQRDYDARIQQINANAASAEESAYKTYQDSLNKRIEALRDFVGLFQAVTVKQTSGNQLMQNLQSQVDAFKSYQESIAGLSGKGLAPDLLAELKAMGPSAAPELQALNNMTSEELAKYSALWLEKSNMARVSATDEMTTARTELNNTLTNIRADQMAQLETARIEMQTKLQEQQATAKEELARMQLDFETTNKAIKDNTIAATKSVTDELTAIAKKTPEYGKKLMQGFADGISNNKTLVTKALKDVQRAIAALMPANSPAKEGPLKRLNVYGPNLIKGYADGIKNSYPLLQSAMDGMADIVGGIGNRPMLDKFGIDTNISNSLGQTEKGASIGIINITGSNADEIWDKFSRELAYAGVKI